MTEKIEEYLADPMAREWADFESHVAGCAECAKGLAEWADDLDLLRRAHPETADRGHPSSKELGEWLEAPGRPAPELAQRVEAHVGDCPDCSMVVQAVRRVDIDAIIREAKSAAGFAGWIRQVMERLRVPLPMPVLALAVLAFALVFLGPFWLPLLQPAETGQSGPGVAVTDSPEQLPSDEGAEVIVAVDPPALTQPPVPVEQGPAPHIAEKPAPLPAGMRYTNSTERSPAESQTTHVAEPILLAALLDALMPSYALPNSDARWELGYIDITTRRSSDVEAEATPRAQAPGHIGLTGQPSPRLWWHLDAESKGPVVLRISSREFGNGLRVEVEEALPGFHALSLSDHGFELEPGVDYQWYVTRVVDPMDPGRNPGTGGAIRRATVDEEQAQRLAAAPPERLVEVYAEFGFWYDAFDVVSAWNAEHPSQPKLEAMRSGLLRQGRKSRKASR